MNNKQPKTYYKYRSMNGENWKYLFDIIMNNRVYCTEYFRLNDPMEGLYTSDNLQKQIIESLAQQKKKIKICSLSKQNNEPLMWSHYADGNKGVVIGLEINQKKVVDIGEIKYKVNKIEKGYNVQAIDLLKFKNPDWSYEQEMRIFAYEQFVKIKITEIIFGSRIDSTSKKILLNMIKIYQSNVIIYEQNRNGDISERSIK